jgi:uncharacterized peroxidase-related enzyme
MSFIETIAPRTAQGAVRSMYERQQAAWGFVPNYAKVFCYRPEVMARWGQLLAEIKRPMTKRRFELATFAAAVELRNTACALAHGKALREFFAEADVRAIAEHRPGEGFTAAERAIVDFARQVARDASAISADDVARLRAHGLTDEEVFDIAASAAGRAFFTKILDALGVEADSSFMALEEPLRGPLTVGRAVGVRAVEMLPAGEPAQS